MNQLVEAIATDNVARLRQRFPTAVRSTNWPLMQKLARQGKYDQALALARDMEKKPHILTQNVVARRMRIARAPFLGHMIKIEDELKKYFEDASVTMTDAILRWADDRKNISKLKARSREMGVQLRRDLRSWIRRATWDGSVLSLKNSQAALLPIFEKNWESVLREDRMSFDMDTSVANMNTPKVKASSDKWLKTIDKIVSANEEDLLGGLKLMQRIYDMTDRAAKEVDRLVVDGIIQGKGPREIARTIQGYLSPATLTDELGNTIIPKGAYYSPYKNALRVARTEVLKTYNQTTAAYAKDKWWIKGIMVNISASHDWDIGCECESENGKIYTPEQYEENVPFHPHCMCYGSYVFDPELEVLAADEPAEDAA